MTTIYVRTAKGQQIAYDAQSEIPRKLRSLLKVIDGKTAASVYAAKLGAFGDVRGMLRSLSLAGMIEAQSESARKVRVHTDNDSDNGFSASRNTRVPTGTYAGDEWAATRGGSGSIGGGMSISPSRQFVASTSVYAPTVALNHAPDLQTDLRHAKTLRTTVDVMASFILTHLPGQSFGILKELEQLTSLEMLAVMLSGYEQMVIPVGEPALHHVRAIKQILRENL